MIKKIFTIKNLVILIITIQSALLLYYFGGQFLNKERLKYLNAGNVQTRDAIYEGVVKEGEVVIKNSKGKDLILIIKGQEKKINK